MNINNHSSRMKVSKEVQNQNMERIMEIKEAFRNARTMKEKQELTKRMFGGDSNETI